jgi:hypothetical protein
MCAIYAKVREFQVTKIHKGSGCMEGLEELSTKIGHSTQLRTVSCISGATRQALGPFFSFNPTIFSPEPFRVNPTDWNLSKKNLQFLWGPSR